MNVVKRILNGIIFLALICAMSLGLTVLVALFLSDSALYIKIAFGILAFAVVWRGAKGTEVAITVRKK